MKRFAAAVFCFVSILILSTFWLIGQEKALSNAEFTRLVETFSEEGGFFHTDNWVSNELSVYDVLEPIERHGVSGGAYIGVGPEQNFVYIRAVEPEIAFIVDIRHQNRIQHLVYKVLFERAETRVEWLALLFSMPVDLSDAPGRNAGIEQVLRFISGKKTDGDMMLRTRDETLATLRNDYGMAVSGRDSLAVTFMFRNFFYYNLNITYRGASQSWYPTIREILLMRDRDGVRQSPFETHEDYTWLRDIHRQNRIVPVTGDYGGTGALRKIAGYLTERDITVSAFYVSNVEQYLLQDLSLWRRWVVNVRALPADGGSVFIRWTHEGSWTGQTRLQSIGVFLENAAAGRYRSYDDLKRLDYLKD